MMICRYPCFADKQSATPHQLLIPIHPNVEILMRLIPRERNVHAFHDATPFRCREKQSSQIDFG
jgi:hypothetical protein